MQKILNTKEKKEARSILRNNATPQEIILWSRIRRSQLGCKFRRQESIGKYIVDFYCPKKKLVIEIDGWQHQENKEYDIERDEFLKSLDLKVLRFWNNEINQNLEGVILKVGEYLK